MCPHLESRQKGFHHFIFQNITRNTDLVPSHTHEQKSHFSGNHLMFFYKLFLVQLRQGLALCFMLRGCELFSVASRENLPFNSQGQGPGVSKHMLCSSAPEQRHGVPPSCIWRLKMTSDLCSTRGKQIEKQHNSSPAKNVWCSVSWFSKHLETHQWWSNDS